MRFTETEQQIANERGRTMRAKVSITRSWPKMRRADIGSYVGAALLVLGLAISALGVLTAATFGSALLFLAMLPLALALNIYYTKRRMLLSLPGFVLGAVGVVIIISANV
jgi:hypothetical protein